MGATDFGAFIPIEAQPAKAVEDRLERGFDIALLVGVVDTKNKLAPLPSCKEPIEQRGANAADVQKTGGTGSEAGADRHGRMTNDE